MQHEVSGLVTMLTSDSDIEQPWSSHQKRSGDVEVPRTHRLLVDTNPLLAIYAHCAWSGFSDVDNNAEMSAAFAIW